MNSYEKYAYNLYRNFDKPKPWGKKKMIRRNPAYDLDNPPGVSHWSERSGEFKPGSSKRLEAQAVATPLPDAEKRLQSLLGALGAALYCCDTYDILVEQVASLISQNKA